MSKNNMQVSVVDNALVVAFLQADSPRVWRIDLDQFSSTALEVVDQKERCVLVMKPTGGTVEEIGAFANKKEATIALQMIVDALKRGSAVASTPKSSHWFIRLIKRLLMLLGLLVVVSFLWMAFKHWSIHLSDIAGKAPAVKTGVPIPAEELFGK